MLSCRQSPLIVTALAVATLLSAAPAEDTVITKTGRTYIGEIIEDKPEGVTIRHERFKGITETDFIARSDIADIKSEAPDLVAFKELQGLLPTADGLAAADYDEILKGAPAAFLQDFPTSKHKAEVEKLIGALEAEKARVAAGDRKIDGAWFSADDLKKDKYNADAALLLAEMKRHAAGGDTLQALRTFDKIESDFPVSKALPTAVPIATGAIDQHEETLRRILADLPAAKERREDFSNLEPAAVARAKNAIRMEDAKWAKIRKDEEAAKVKWRSVYAHSEDDIKKALGTAEKERTRLRRFDTKKAGRIAAAASQAFVAYADGDYKQAIGLLNRAKAAGARDRVIGELLADATEKQKEYLASTEAERAAAALQAQLTQQQGSTIAPTASGSNTPAPKERSAPAPKPEPAPEPSPEPTPEKAAPKPSATPVAAVTSEKKAGGGDRTSLRPLLLVALGVVVVGMLVAQIVLRKKGMVEEDI